MLTISFEADVSTLSRDLPDWARNRIPSITRNALNDAARDAVEAERKKILGVFDRPTPFIQKAPILQKWNRATKDNLEAIVEIRDEVSGTPPSKVLKAQVLGGARKPKAFELRLRRAGIMREDEFATVAMGFRRNQYGNIPGSTLIAILSQLQAAEQVGGYLANETKFSKARAGGKRTRRYFVPKEGSSLRRGIYMREGKKVTAVMIFVRQPTYSRRYDFGQAAASKAQRVFAGHFQRYFDAELAKRSAVGPSGG